MYHCNRARVYRYLGNVILSLEDFNKATALFDQNKEGKDFFKKEFFRVILPEVSFVKKNLGFLDEKSKDLNEHLLQIFLSFKEQFQKLFVSILTILFEDEMDLSQPGNNFLSRKEQITQENIPIKSYWIQFQEQINMLLDKMSENSLTVDILLKIINENTHIEYIFEKLLKIEDEGFLESELETLINKLKKFRYHEKKGVFEILKQTIEACKTQNSK